MPTAACSSSDCWRRAVWLTHTHHVSHQQAASCALRAAPRYPCASPRVLEAQDRHASAGREVGRKKERRVAGGAGGGASALSFCRFRCRLFFSRPNFRTCSRAISSDSDPSDSTSSQSEIAASLSALLSSSR
eukprot:7380869-Prymnesium_polylepis.1